MGESELRAVLVERIAGVRGRIAEACRRAGRAPAGVTLVAVTKTVPAQRVQLAIDLGVKRIGENRVQEARVKLPALQGEFEAHLIGHLQSNKAGAAALLFPYIQSVDSLPLAERLSRICTEQGRVLKVLWEVNTSGESSKFGFGPERLGADAAALAALPALEPRGLMTLGPLPGSGQGPGPCFRRLRELRDGLEDALGRALPELSMGMSGDFEAAIEAGSTMVRIGSALFGPREN